MVNPNRFPSATYLLAVCFLFRPPLLLIVAEYCGFNGLELRAWGRHGALVVC